MNPRRNLTVAGAIAATAILAACSGTPTPAASSGRAPSSAPTTAASRAPTTAATTGQPAPRVTESNPQGDIPDNTAYVAFSPAGGGYSVKIPEGWARTSGGTMTSFTDKLNHIEVSTAAAPSHPTLASVTNIDVPALKATVPKFAMGKVSTVVRHGGTAILLTYQGDSAPDQVTGKVVRDAFERYTFYRAGKRVDLTLSGPTNADNVDPWRIISDSLRWS
ncbi:MAG: hypothetical protein ABI662_10330 [Dermatophilaceae bacterium]